MMLIELRFELRLFFAKLKLDHHGQNALVRGIGIYTAAVLPLENGFRRRDNIGGNCRIPGSWPSRYDLGRVAKHLRNKIWFWRTCALAAGAGRV